MKTRLGLVCMTSTEEVRFRTVTRARFLEMSRRQQIATLEDIYADNLQRLFKALAFCYASGIHLYRATNGLFPLNDEPVGEIVLQRFADAAGKFSSRAKALDVRVLLHPDQFVVLNSMRPEVIDQSIHILSRHALSFDLLGLPRSSWAAMIVHGGKSGRAEQLIRTVERLPESIRSRLVLENDESAYSTAEILAICKATSLPMVFDPHHHVVKEKLESYEHPTVAWMVEAARNTWPDRRWQVAHISNGATSFSDPRHSDLVDNFPTALFSVPWVEVEAKGKERAIFHLRKRYPALR